MFRYKVQGDRRVAFCKGHEHADQMGARTSASLHGSIYLGAEAVEEGGDSRHPWSSGMHTEHQDTKYD